LKRFPPRLRDFPDLAKAEAAAIVADLAKLETDPALFGALQRRAFIEKGLELVDGPECPLCDSPWEDEQRLIDHLKEKLAKSEQARKLQQALLANGAVLAKSAISVTGHIRLAQSIAEAQGEPALAQQLTDWKKDLEQLQSKLTTVDGL
jgi:hypothetical protein